VGISNAKDLRNIAYGVQLTDEQWEMLQKKK
jgi:hypothetical protein